MGFGWIHYLHLTGGISFWVELSLDWVYFRG
jgi:hypothetical protein